MALDLIKEYLIGIGFKVDGNSLNDTEKSIDQAQKKVEEFNNNSNKGFSETNDSLKDLFSLLSSSGETIGKIFPELKGPFQGLIKDINLVKKLYNDITKGTSKKEQSKSSNIKQDGEKPIITKGADIIDSSKGLIENLSQVKGATKSLALKGGTAIKAFAATTAGSFFLIGTAVVGAIAATKKLVQYLGDLAKKDIEYEKLSRQLWTTRENAKDVDSALKILGTSMDDLWLSPTLLNQFNQLRKDSAQLRLPPEFKDNIKVIQGLGLEFKRLKQLVSLAFQWIGNYILKYLAGPLNDIKKGLSKFNNGLLKAIPVIAKIIGSALGIILRLILTVGKVLSPIFSIISKILGIIISLIDKIPEPVKKILKIIGAIAALIVAGPLGAIMLVIAAIDDFLTFLSGGKSVIGSVFDFFKEKGSTAIEYVKGKFSNLKEKFKEGMAAIKDDWSRYWDKAKNTLDKLEEKAKKVWGNIKEWSKGLWEKTKDFATNIGAKIEVFNKNSNENFPPDYVNSNSVSNSTSMANSNNKITNTNTFNVYGSEAETTANTINRKITGVAIRTVQGVY